MKRKNRFTLLLSLCLAVLMSLGFFLTACNEPNDQNQNDSSSQNLPTSIVLSETNIKLAPDETHQLFATVSPLNDDTKIAWSSLNTKVVTVDSNGIVTGLAAGTGVVRATTENNLVASCTVTVEMSVGSLEVYVTAKKGLNGAIVADTNSKIILIPENLESFPNDFDLYGDFSSYGIFSGTANTDGKKIFNNIPIGKYRVVLQSEKIDDTTSNKLELMGTDAPTQKGEEKIKSIFGDNLYQKLQALKKQIQNDSDGTVSQYTWLSWNISFGYTLGRSVEIKKNETESLSVEFSTI